MNKHFDSLFDVMDAFPDEQSCLDHLRSIRWNDGEFCPHCGCGRIMQFGDKKTFKCSDCRLRFSTKVGTIFQDTKLPLRKWFMSIWLISNDSEGIASTTLAKDLKITQKSAWFVLHRLRHATRTPSFAGSLGGQVEADTTSVGGKEKNKHAKKKTPGLQGGAIKAVKVGMIQRDGELRTTHVADAKASTLQRSIRRKVAPKFAVLTDEDRAIVGLAKYYLYRALNHSAGEYVRPGGWVHTDSIKAAWVLLTRQIYGIHHYVPDKHLQRSLAEMTRGCNRRHRGVTDLMNALFAIVERPMQYMVLIA